MKHSQALVFGSEFGGAPNPSSVATQVKESLSIAKMSCFDPRAAAKRDKLGKPATARFARTTPSHSHLPSWILARNYAAPMLDLLKDLGTELDGTPRTVSKPVLGL